MLDKYKVIIYFISVILAGYDLIIEGLKNILHLNFEEDTLMTIAIIAAFIIGDYPESVAILLLFKLGEFIENKAIEKTNRNINSIASIQVKKANVIENKTVKVINAKDIVKGQVILIKPGEVVPADCKILEGESSIDTSSLTGESEPKFVQKGQEILSGSIVLNGTITCDTIKNYGDSAISKIADLVYEATNNKGKKEEYITKFSKIYTPIVIILAILLVVIPLILGQEFEPWLNRALVFLVASCPCSIVISIPLAYFSCIGAISKNGMLVKGTKNIEELAKAKVIAFDKTGTITTGKIQIKEINSLNKDVLIDEIMTYAYSLEKNSNHPISNAIIDYANDKKLNSKEVKNQKELVGLGIYGEVENEKVCVGNIELLNKMKISYKEFNIPENAIIIAKNEKVLGYILLKEELRNGIKETIKKLKILGLKKVVMLTGDNKKNAEKIAFECGNIEYKSELLPEGKVKELNKLKEENKVIFVGDGINDSPVLANSNFGIAMGEGTDIAESASDGILISNNINALPEIIKIARKTIRIVNENITLSLLAKLIVLILGVLGKAPIWLAVAADTGITLITVMNPIRIFNKIRK